MSGIKDWLLAAGGFALVLLGAGMLISFVLAWGAVIAGVVLVVGVAALPLAVVHWLTKGR